MWATSSGRKVVDSVLLVVRVTVGDVLRGVLFVDFCEVLEDDGSPLDIINTKCGSNKAQ